MKRQAAINKLKEFLKDYESDGFDEELEDDADSLLSMLEGMGMKPPIIKEQSFKILPSGEQTYAVHEWEQE